MGAALEERACEKAIAREGLACYGSHRATGERYPRLLASLDDIETRANPLLVRIFSRPGEFAFELASNVATQDLGRMLASLSAGEPDGMMALIGNRGTPSRPRRRPGGHQKQRLAGFLHSSHHTQARTTSLVPVAAAKSSRSAAAPPERVKFKEKVQHAPPIGRGATRRAGSGGGCRCGQRHPAGRRTNRCLADCN